MKETGLLSIHADSNIGLYFFSVGEVLFSGIRLRTEQKRMIERILKVRIVSLSIAGTPYPGLFLIEAKGIILAPSIIFEHEKKKVEKESGLKVLTINTSQTALRNIIGINKEKAIISSNTDKNIIRALHDLGISTLIVEHEEFDNIGSMIIAGNNKGIISPIFEKRTIKKLEKHLSIELIETTVNNRQLFISSGIIHNNNGIIIGQDSITEEVMDITEGLS
ncbi:MAG: hypothetical protein ACMXYL_01455 [Candidatus Woesearchaeota archaeon]